MQTQYVRYVDAFAISFWNAISLLCFLYTLGLDHSIVESTQLDHQKINSNGPPFSMVNWETIQILNITNVAVPINIKSVYKHIILFV